MHPDQRENVQWSARRYASGGNDNAWGISASLQSSSIESIRIPKAYGEWQENQTDRHRPNEEIEMLESEDEMLN